MWFPVIIFFYGFHWLDPWVVWVSSVWAHLQGFVSSSVSLMKPDIGKAVKDFVSCRIWFDNPDVPSNPIYNVGPQGFSSSLRKRFSSLLQNSTRSNSPGDDDNTNHSQVITDRSTHHHSTRSISAGELEAPPRQSHANELYTDDLRQSLVTYEFEDEAPNAVEHHSGETEDVVKVEEGHEEKRGSAA